MSADRPDLRAVGEDEIVESSPVRAPAAQEKSRAAGWVIGLLVLALVLAFGAYWNESQRALALEGRVAALHAEIEEARNELRVHEERMQVVRGHVDDLAGRIGLLQQAVATEGE